MNIKLISKYLIYLRKLKGYSQENLADEVGISRQAVSKWETGNSLPDLDILLKLSKLYGKSINELLEPHIENRITSFEEIVEVNPKLLKSVLSTFEMEDIIKSSMGASPTVCELLKEIFPAVDFELAITSIGRVKVEEIESVHNQMVSMVNLEV